jgi:hypothetical protein
MNYGQEKRMKGKRTMRKKQRKKATAAWILLLTVCLLFGCTQKPPAVEADAEQAVAEPPPETEETVVAEVTAEEEPTPEMIEINGVSFPAPPEGYVYDFQASSEPIPEEIAALGGPVQGTIHAYPSLIMKELMRLELEQDPEKKKEADMYAEEIKAYLLDRYGAECEVELMEVDKDFDWTYWCKEIDTGYIFYIEYEPSNSSKKIFYDTYLFHLLGEKIQPQIEKVVKNTLGESFVMQISLQPHPDEPPVDFIDIETMDFGCLYLRMAVFTGEEVDKLEEQRKILELWDKINHYMEHGSIWLQICYYDDAYRDVVDAKYNDGNEQDILGIYDNREILLETNEIREYFDYDSLLEEQAIGHPDINLTTILEEYRNGIPVTEEWNYWQ